MTKIMANNYYLSYYNNRLNNEKGERYKNGKGNGDFPIRNHNDFME